MSYIDKLLKEKGDAEFLRINEDSVFEGGGEYCGYQYMILFNNAWRCGYIELPEGYSGLFDDEGDDEYIDVHGEITQHGKLPNLDGYFGVTGRN